MAKCEALTGSAMKGLATCINLFLICSFSAVAPARIRLVIASDTATINWTNSNTN